MMMPINHDSPRSIRNALSEMGIALKKRWGQNFLVSRSVRERILGILAPSPGEEIWELGPGLGAMTELILAAGAKVTAFEIDRGLCRHLVEVFGHMGGFSLVQGDFLKTWRDASTERPPVRIFGNLPYSSASLMIASLAEEGTSAERLVFTVQKELAERILAKPGKKAYSSFSVLSQVAFHVKGHGDLKPGGFYPAPEVISSIVELRPNAILKTAAERRMFSRLIRALFASRRKTLRNNIVAGGILEDASEERIVSLLEGEGIDPGARAESLHPEAFVRLARRLDHPRGPTSP
jgi:16S rRNA (adenine1518-N6/adenine1519-N6)-dimethyltransferase